MSHEPMTLDTDEPSEALRQIASYLRTLSMRDGRAVVEYGEVVGYYQLTEWLHGLLEIADECDRIRALAAEPACSSSLHEKMEDLRDTESEAHKRWLEKARDGRAHEAAKPALFERLRRWWNGGARGWHATPSELRASGLIPDGYELLPVEVIEALIDAGCAAYGPAILQIGRDMREVHNATRAAENVLERMKQRQPEY